MLVNILGFVWVVLLLGVEGARTYLSERDNWNIEYSVYLRDGCNVGEGKHVYYSTGLHDIMRIMDDIIERNRHCRIGMVLQVKLVQDSVYVGIGVKSNGTLNYHTTGFAIGDETAAKIFSPIPYAYQSGIWLMGFTSSIKTVAGTCSLGNRAMIKSLDAKDATLDKPSVLSDWTVLTKRGQQGDVDLWSLPVPMLNGGFQVGSTTAVPDLIKHCELEVEKVEVSFAMVLQEKEDFYQNTDEWRAEYTVDPFCTRALVATNCRSGILSLSEVQKCVEQWKKQDSNCTLQIQAKLIQEKLQKGLVYDSKGSQTGVLALDKGTLKQTLGAIPDRQTWVLDQVQFYGFSPKATKQCAEGLLLYNNELLKALPNADKPVNWSSWKGHENENPSFHFIGIPQIESLQSSDGIYRSNFHVKIPENSDLMVAISQTTTACDWEQSGGVILAKTWVGPEVDINDSKDRWKITYGVSLGDSDSCSGNLLTECTYLGPDLHAVQICADRIKSLRPHCELNLDIELFQDRGHGGVIYNGVNSSTFGLEISKEVTKKVFKGPVAGNNQEIYLSTIKIEGFDANPDCLNDMYKRLVYQNKISTKIPVDFSGWQPVHQDSKGNYQVKLDPDADFQLAVNQSDHLDCDVVQKSAYLRVTNTFVPL